MQVARTRFNEDLVQNYIDYFQNGGASSGIVFSDKEAAILERVRFADEKIRERKNSRERIANFIMGKFDVCRDTAYKDLVMAERVFSSSYPLNKNSIVEARIESLQKRIDNYIIDKEFIAAEMAEKNLQKYIDMYKDIVPKRSPKTINYIIQNNIHQTNITIEQALHESEEILKLLEKSEDY